MTYFVVIAAETKAKTSQISLWEATSAKGAHKAAADQIRKDYDLPKNIHIQTRTAFSGDEESAKTFFVLLNDHIDQERDHERTL